MLVEILRPVNVIMVFVSVLAGGWVGLTPYFSLPLLIISITSALSSGFGNIINDYFDVDSDKINHPGRPLPSGRIDKRTALIYAMLLFVISLLLSFWVGLIFFIITSAAGLLLFLYARVLKNTFFSNSIVALLCSLAFIVGGLVTKNVLAVFPAAFAFLFHYSREILKDVLDMKGDIRNKTRSMALTVGPENSLRLAANILVLLIIFLPVPVILGQFRLRYLIAVAAILMPILIFIIINLFRRIEIKTLNLLNTLLKIGMLAGLLSLCLV